MLRQMIAGSSALLLLLQPALVSAKAAFHPGEGWNRSHTAYYINSQPAEGLVETDGGLCLFEKGTAVTGEVQINGLNYFFHPETSYAATHEWITIKGKDYWYVEGVRQGDLGDPLNIRDTIYGVERGREIYDRTSQAWYWLDAADHGAKGVNRDVWLPYLYRDEAPGSSHGKWVRYDEDGQMEKGISYSYYYKAWYYFDPTTGAMAKGWRLASNNQWAYYDPVNGKLYEDDFKLNDITFTVTPQGTVDSTLHYGVPYFSQTDSRWANYRIGTSTIRSSGCGVTVGAMLIDYLTGYGLTPIDTAKMFYNWGDYNNTYGHGTASTAWRKVANRYGFSFRNKLTIASCNEYLRKGYMIVANVGPGLFVSGNYTHALLLFGLDGRGRTFVLDPEYSSRNGWYNVTDIFRQKSTAGVDTMDGGPFFAIGY